MTNLKHPTAKARMGKAILTAAAALIIGLMTSCSMMHDDQKDCRQELRVDFSYDMNMKFADAFPNEVKSVTLYAYDADGRLAMQKAEKVDDIEGRGGYMQLDGLQPGRYTLMVWAEGEQRQSDSYIYGLPTSTTGGITALDCRINRQTDIVNHDLTALYHGLVKNADLTLDGYGVKTVTVPLTKDTNVIRVVLQNASGKQLNADDFTFTIDDRNAWLAYDNTLKDNTQITYAPWSQYDGITRSRTHTTATTAAEKEETEPVTPVSAVVAEMTVNRLFAQSQPRLKVVNNRNGETIFNVPFIDYALLVKGNYNSQMTDQEYLDRQDEYNFVFFIDDNHNWLAASIIVNSWQVVLQNTDL